MHLKSGGLCSPHLIHSYSFLVNVSRVWGFVLICVIDCLVSSGLISFLKLLYYIVSMVEVVESTEGWVYTYFLDDDG